MAAMIAANDNFYVGSTLSGRVYLEPCGNALGHTWVRTYPNGFYDDNLYALPTF